VEGHTDDVPIATKVFPSNWHLSVSRAVNTAFYLITRHGLNPDKIAVVGYSEFKPLVENNSEENRAKNRRVDIVILDIPEQQRTKE
jgi:chemotaxis protein MotB